MEHRVVDYSLARRRMIRELLIPNGIQDSRVLEAMGKVPREHFVADGMRDQAYLDQPLNIGDRQTISQPVSVAKMTQALELTGSERILEIGTGSGYQTSILMETAGEIYSIERLKKLSYTARKKLYALGYDGFQLRIGDGTLGWPEAAPFDGIIVTAGSPQVPPVYGEQLKEGGILVVPVGNESNQILMRFRKVDGQMMGESLGACRFVKLIGDHGWADDSNPA